MSSLWNDLVIGVRIGRGTVRDRFRRHTSSRREKALFALLALLLLPSLFLFLRQSYAFGVATRGGVTAPVLPVARNLLVPGLLVLAVIAGLESIQQLGSDSIRPLLLTSASTRAIVIGKIVSLLVSWLILVVVGFALVIAYAVGARAPLFPVSVAVAALPLFVLVLLLGLALGYGLWLGVERLGLSEGIRQLLTAGLYIVVVGLMFVGGSLLGGGAAGSNLSEILPTDDPTIPIGWYADLLFVGSPMEPVLGIQTLLAAAIVLGGIPLGFSIVVRLAPRYWYATPADDSTEDSERTQEQEVDRTPSETIGRVPGTVSGRFPTVRAALGYLRSGRRQPGQFVYLFYYIFPIAPILAQQAISDPGSLPLSIGASLVLLGVWLAGGLFCLNPLGSEGTMLSQLVLAKRPAQTFTHARFLLGIGIGTLLSVTGIAIFVYSHGSIPALAALAAVLLVPVAVTASAGLALGLGALLPKFEAVEIFESVETVAPSLIAAVLHAFLSVLFLAGAIGLALLTGTSEEIELLTDPQKLAVVGIYVLLAAVVADWGRRYAVARLRDYGRDVVRTGRAFAVYTSFGMVALAILLGQLLALFVVILLGVDISLTVLLPVLFILEYAAYALVGLGFLYVTHRGRSYIDRIVPSVRDIAIVAVGLLASLAIWVVASVLIAELGLPAADHALFDPEEDGTTTLLLVLIPLVLLINGPVEEFVFRNVIQKYLTERFSAASAITIASLIFAVAHVPAYLTAGFGALWVTLSLLFLISLLWGVIYHRTDSLFVVSAVHGLYNATLIFGLYLTIS